VTTNLRIARRCGWRYEWIDELAPDVYEALCDDLREEQRIEAQR
jgi:hypothetical protein